MFYCGTGGRSALATHVAVEMGLDKSVSLAGGFGAWKAAGGPIESAAKK
ncbi:MAG TPA: rhodanese-like domain-containing protein [Gammaproteobacteria bacterium]